MLQTTLILLFSIGIIILLSAKFKINTFFVLLFVALGVGLLTQNSADLVASIKTGFGHTLEKVGLLVILGTTLGLILEKTRATESLSNYILKKTGQANAEIAITLIGFTIGLPIFCDSGFIVLIGLVLNLSQKVKGKHLIYCISLATSLLAVHCLVPPHPGITAAAGILGVDLGKAMLLNTLLAIPATLAGYFWVISFGKKIAFIEPEMVLKTSSNNHLPRAIYSVLPILIPIMLIALKSILGVFSTDSTNHFIVIVNFIGEPVIALLIGIIICYPLAKSLKTSQINEIFEDSIEKAGPILAIIAAGGAFGAVIQGLDLGKVYGNSIGELGLSIFAPFILAAIFKTAQGSSTVAAISTASIILPLMASLGLKSELDKLLTLASIGAGSMLFSHANDAYFWVITRFSKITTKATYSLYSTATVIMSLTTLLFIFLVKVVFS
ncbi:MAG: GntP family permease [Bacteroidota bacterium]